jgi:signal transduction histidine kinase
MTEVSDSRPRILVVDDMRTNLLIMSEYLSPDYQVLTATSGRQALSMVASGPKPDLVLLDVVMPQMSGYDVLRALRGVADTTSIPVIFLTSDTSVQAATEGLDLGADDFVTKPIEPHLLRARVRNVLQRESMRRAQLDALRDQVAKGAKLAELGKLVASFSHDIGNPISNCLITASSIADIMHQLHGSFESQTLRRSSLLETIHTVEEGIGLAMRNLTRANDLLVSFKQQALDQATAQIRTIELKTWVDELLLTVSPMLAATAHRCLSTVGMGINLSTQPGPLAQVLVNLINNALIHGMADRAAGTITIGAARGEDGAVTVSVDDDGCGMTPAVREHAFDPFFTTRAQSGGTGLGLDIVLHIVEGALGGALSLRTAPGEGSHFTLHLPQLAP